MPSILKANTRQAVQIIKRCLEAGLVPFVQGPPGMGKSSITKLVARLLNLYMIDHRISTGDATDATGFPRPVTIRPGEDRTRFIPLELFPLEGDPIPEGFDGFLLFLDEFNAAPKQVQAGFYKLVLDKKVGPKNLHPNTAMVLAGNLSTDKAVVNSLSTAMQSRLVHIELIVDHTIWYEDVAVPEQYDPRIITFLAQYPSLLMDFDPDHKEKTFCCPRTWEFVNAAITSWEEDENDNLIRAALPIDETMQILLSGTITSGVALRFADYDKICNSVVKPSEILKDPLAATLPIDSTTHYATIGQMLEKLDNTTFTKFGMYCDRFPMSFRILAYRMMIARKKDLPTHRDFSRLVAPIADALKD